MTLLLLSLLACDPKVEVDDTAVLTDTDADTDTDTDTDADSDADSDADADANWHILATTTDYTTGSLARIDSDGSLTDGFLGVSSDSALRVDQFVYLLQRSSENTVSMYTPDDYSAPLAEFSTGDGSNPTGAALCAKRLFVARQLAGDIAIYDPTTGFQVGAVDVNPWEDEDGSSEPDSLYVADNGYLYATLLQLDYLKTYASVDGTGQLVKIDCAAGTVVEDWETGPNPNLTPGPDAGAGFYLSGGDYYLPDYSGPKLDGGVWYFDTTTDTMAGPYLSEADLGVNIGGFQAAQNGYAITTFDDGYRWSVGCVDTADWSIIEVDVGNVFVPATTIDPQGNVWVAQAPGFDYSDSDTSDDQIGITRWNPGKCASSTSVATALSPSSLVTVRPAQ